MKKILLTIATVAVVAVSAWAQITYVQAGKAYVFTGSPSYGTSISYQWYRNGQPIQGETGASYTLPGSLAHGERVEIKRGTMSAACPDEVNYTNSFTLTFCNVVTGAIPNAVCWADVNVDYYQTFAIRPDMHTRFYQWNRTTAYSVSDPLTPAWNNTVPESETWTVNPCPIGWRLPTLSEMQALNNTGSVWTAANDKGNAVAGRFYGPSYNSCSLLTSMEGCIFLPASGYRFRVDGTLGNRNTYLYIWTSTQASSTEGYHLNANSGSSNPTLNIGKAYGFPIRCVR